MPIVTISRGSYSRGKEIAEATARRLGYECVAREVLIEASSDFNVREVKLIHALEDPPSFFDRFTGTKEKYIAYIQSALMKKFMEDNIVYHGLAGQYFVHHLPNVLKVRVVADMQDRVKYVMERDNLPENNARKAIEDIDRHRKSWGYHLYGFDPEDPLLYDMVLRIGNLTIDDAVDAICHTVSRDSFKTTPELKKHLEELYLASLVKAAVVEKKPDVDVWAEDGKIIVETSSLVTQEHKWQKLIEESAKTVPGVDNVEIRFKMSEYEAYD